MSVNYVKLSTPSSRYQMAAIERTLKEGAFCAEQISQQLNITRRRANEYLKRLRDENKIHIHKYESVLAASNKYPVAFFIHGPGVDAIRAAKTKADCNREYRARCKNDPAKQAKIKAKKKAYNEKIRVDPNKRTVYENKLWRDRHRTPRCDIAASWIK